MGGRGGPLRREVGSNGSAFELGVAKRYGATVTASRKNCDRVSSRDVTESRGSIKSPKSLRGVLMGCAGRGGAVTELPARLEGRNDVWPMEIRWVGSTGYPGQ